MTCVIYPDFVTDTVQCHGSCLTKPGETLGQVIFYKKGFNYDVAVAKDNFDYNVTLISGVKKSDYFDLYLATIK